MNSRNFDIAIVGIGCRFPGGADTPQAFWDLLEKGFDAITEYPASRSAFREAYDPDPKKPGRTYLRRGGFLEGIDLFDAQFFGISPREALHIDPQQRLLLELVQEACEDAGIPPPSLAGTRTGVFIGISTHDYGDIHFYPQNRADIDMHTNSGIATSIAANRISYLYDLRGPSLAIDTACSSALTAVHMACRSLLAGESQTALAGGVQLLLAPEVTIGFSKASMLSRDGKCRAFDVYANGYVRSEGAGVVVLKPIQAALEAGDRIYAVIRATVINQDGHTPGMTVPSAASQQAMIEEALAMAGVAARDVQYVEAHGTGTPVGDPIEALAIGSAMGRDRRDGEFCAIGSVKTNLGHLEAASGMPGLIKVALSLRNRRIPPSLHFSQAPESIDMKTLRLRMVTELEPWPAGAAPALAGVNSFGFGGANAHVLLQGVDVPAPPAAEPSIPRLLVLSAKTPEALKDLAAASADRLRDAVSLRDFCYTAAERRAHFDYRLAITATNREDFSAYLFDFVSGIASANLASGRAVHGPARRRRRPMPAPSPSPQLAFVFSGMGPQWWGMGRQLRASEPVFRETLERCDAALRPHSGWSLLDELSADEATSRAASPELAQVTNFAIQMALLELWASWGIEPDTVIGHSGGAIAAACAAGVYDLEDAIRLAYHRSRLQARPSNFGQMLAVGAPFTEIEPLLAGSEHRVCLAAVNGPVAITLAGDPDTLDRILVSLQERRIFARMLSVTIAYHSHVMEGIRDEFLSVMHGLRGRKAQIPFVSDTTGTWASGEECDEHYWWRAIRQPVLFRDGIRTILDSGITNFVEIGPHPVLVSPVLECMKEGGAKGVALPSIRRAEDERAAMLRSLGALYTIGCTPHWPALREEGAGLAELPHYPWQRKRYWFEPGAAMAERNRGAAPQSGDHPLLGVRLRGPRPAWENALGQGASAWLQEHLVQGSPISPGAAHVEMALAACREEAAGKEIPVLLRDVEFLKPLVLRPDQSVPVQFALDPETGRFEVFSSANSDSSVWICHARGLATVQQPRELARFDLDRIRARVSDSVPADVFYKQIEERTLVYGPVFRGIRELWSGQGEALGLIELASPPDLTGYCVHPALLDAAFQVLVAAADSSPELSGTRRLFLPIQVREFRFHASPGAKFLSHAIVVSATNTNVGGDLQIANENGDLCIELKGLTARLADPAGHAQRDTIDQWLYDYRWEPAPLAARATDIQGHLPSPGIELPQLCAQADALSAGTGWHLYYQGAERALNALAAAYVAEASLSPEVVADATGWRLSLAHQALLVAERFGNSGSSAEQADALLRDYPGYRLDIELLQRCGPRLADVVTGRADGREVLFTPEGFAFLEQFYRASPASAFYNVLTADLIADFASAFDQGRKLRVLEAGAGTGGTTSLVLPRLKPDCVDYIFSDVSQLFLDRARAKFGAEYPFLQTRLFDVAKDAAPQGFADGSFDLILAANVLHATPDVSEAVARLRRLLAPGGVLVLLEITSHPWWLDIVFGLMDGWWKFEDRARRPNHPLMSAEQWQSLLAECGFENPAVLADRAPGESAQSIVFGRRPLQDEINARPWLVLADERGVAERLADVLQPCRLVRAGEAPPPGDYEGVVHLRSLDAPRPEDSLPSGNPDCASVLSALQNVVQGSPLADRHFIVVTAGAQIPLAGEEPALLQNPVWGLGRVLRKEWPNLRSRLVDLSASCTDEDIEALSREILAREDPPEEEIAIRGNQRFVHRLRPTTLAGISESAPAVAPQPGEQWHAEVTAPGSLDSVAFLRASRESPGPNEVEVAVAATSLNFRDVVIAMGAVANMETENSFGARKLGLDFSGTVTRRGNAVSHLREGDEVFGLTSRTFAAYALAHASVVAPKPPNLTLEQAATIPVAFLTAHYALRHLARLQKGESILIHVASGGVGLAAVQMAKLVGARIFATAGSPAKRAYLESLGIADVMDSRTLTFAGEIAERTGGRGVDVVLNSLSGEAIDLGVAALAPFGRFVELGKGDIYKNSRLQLLPFRKNLALYSVDLDRVCVERAEFAGQMLREIAEEFASGALVPVPVTEFPMSELASAMRFMSQAKHIGKIVVSNHAPVAVRATIPPAPDIRADATYLITGCLGGLGLATARWLAERGATSLVLMGRNPPSLEIEGYLGQLRDRGVRVSAIAADVSKDADVARVFDTMRIGFPPLRGILHAAMVLEDTPLADLDQSRWNRVMAPKVEGAWNLHRHSLASDLDFFVCFSSITSLLGNPMQANYAAANAFLDAFASWRRLRGLPATTINWGVVGGAGYVSRHREMEEFLHRQGYGSFTEKQTLEVLSEMLRRDVVQIMAARIDWRRLADIAPAVAASTRIRHLVPAAERPGGGPGNAGLPALLADADPAVRAERVEQFLKEHTARLLGAAPTAIDADRPIIELGLDSLIAAELTVVIERDLKVEIAATRMLGGMSVRGLASEVLALLHPSAEERPPAAPAPQPGFAEPVASPEPAPQPVPAASNGHRTNYASLDYADWTPAQQAIRFAVAAGLHLLGRIETEGFENIPRHGPCLLAVNHLSMVDVPLLLTQLPRRAIILANDRLRQNPLFDWFISDMGQAIYVKNNQADEESLDDALTVLRSGGMIALAPEGTRSRTGGLLRGKTGVAWLATQADVPVVPLAAWGQEKWRDRGKRLSRIPIRVRAGVPLQFAPGAATPVAMRQYTDRIMSGIAELLPPEYRGVYSDPQ